VLLLVNFRCIYTDWLRLTGVFLTNDDTDVNEMSRKLDSILMTILTTQVPKKLKKEPISEHWLDKQLRSLRNKRNKLHQKLKNNNICNNLERDLYLKLYNEFETKSNLSYESYINNLRNIIIDNPREFHKFIASKRKTNGFPAIMHLDDNRASNPQHISYLFASRFKKVYSPSSNSVSPDFSYMDFFLMFQQLKFRFKTFTLTCLN
jgi:hypothetical protein